MVKHKCEIPPERNGSFSPCRSSTCYSPYGYAEQWLKLRSLPSFNAEHLDRVSGCYLLGNGHRCYSPVLMRFLSPDRLAPFGPGGINLYAYCLGDPVNRHDPDGQASSFADMFRSVFLGRKTRQQRSDTKLLKQKALVREQGNQARNNFNNFEETIKLNTGRDQDSKRLDYLKGLPGNEYERTPDRSELVRQTVALLEKKLSQEVSLQLTAVRSADAGSSAGADRAGIIAVRINTASNIAKAHSAGALNKQLQKKLKYLRQGYPGHR